MNLKKLWVDCLSEIELNISKANFTTWFKNTSIVKEEEGTIYVGVPNEFVKDCINKKLWKEDKKDVLLNMAIKDLKGTKEFVSGINLNFKPNDFIQPGTIQENGEQGGEKLTLSHLRGKGVVEYDAYKKDHPAEFAKLYKEEYGMDYNPKG